MIIKNTNNTLLPDYTLKTRILLTGLFLVFYTSIYAVHDKQVIEAEKAVLIGGASKVADKDASEGFSISLNKTGQAIKFTNLPAANKLAIRYASVNTGTISVIVNNQPAVKVNIHSSGAVTGYFLHAIIDLSIPSQARVVISFEANDVALNIDKIILGNGNLDLPPDIWNLPPLPVADGPYPSDWKGLSRIYEAPAWWREAKFGAWSHWDPQSMPERGDWYARGMYMEDNWQYNHHLKHFGHPSEYGYKDICHHWVIDRFEPERLMDLYIEMGARYFMAMGVHHDNFDCWDSKYQPWNSVNVGPKADIVGIWEKEARKRGMRFGIGFHHTPARTWGQFMTVRYTSDNDGSMKAVPYDALHTIKEGKGKWWEGLDPVDLYGPVHDIKNPLQSPYANQFMWRVDDAITKYRPDLIYFDEHAGDSQIDLGVQMGLGFLAPQLIANYYNKSMQWNNGKMDVVINLKGVGGRYNSFQNNPELLPYVDRSLVKSNEFIIEPEIMAYPFQTEASISDWHYRSGQQYMNPVTVIKMLMESVSRNGSLLFNVTQHGKGDIDAEAVRICKDVGVWLKINGEAIYGSRPFEVCGDTSVFYTRNNGHIYATVLNWNDNQVTLEALRSGGSTLGKVSKVELIGSDITMKFEQNEKGLTITQNGLVQSLPGINDQALSKGARVFRIAHDKGWMNDDDPGVVAPSWFRQCNLETGDFNNDLTMSDTPGDVWSCVFTGNYLAVIAPKEKGAGKMEIQIDGKTHSIIDLSITGERKPQQVACTITDLAPGKHTLNIINRGNGKVAIDALRIKR